jgi:hypothetical protein
MTIPMLMWYMKKFKEVRENNQEVR